VDRRRRSGCRLRAGVAADGAGPPGWL